MLLHGHAPLAARYLVAAGLGRLLVTGEAPGLAASDPSFRLEKAPVGAAAGPRTWGGAPGGRVLLGVEPREGPLPLGAARAILETLGAGEALRLLLGLPGRRYEFA